MTGAGAGRGGCELAAVWMGAGKGNLCFCRSTAFLLARGGGGEDRGMPMQPAPAAFISQSCPLCRNLSANWLESLQRAAKWT